MINVNISSAVQVVMIAALLTVSYMLWRKVEFLDALAIICIGMYASRFFIWEVLVVLALFFHPVQVVVHIVWSISIVITCLVIRSTILNRNTKGKK